MVFIYILKLQQEKYYIGKTNNPRFRLEEHFKNGGSQWTKKYKPIKILKIISNCDDYDEDAYTLRYMNKYGINNVRGGQFVRLELPVDDLKFIKNSLRSSGNLCFRCGKSGHFIANCNQQKDNYIELVESIELSSNDSYENCLISSEEDFIDPLDQSLNESAVLIISDYDKGYKKGYNDGHSKGFRKGKNQKIEETFNDTTKKAYLKGHQDGYYEGYEYGLNKKWCCIIL